MTVPGCGECPDFFEMPVDGDATRHKWVFWTAANGKYICWARSTARRFTRGDRTRCVGDWGANYYAVQTYSDIPPPTAAASRSPG